MQNLKSFFQNSGFLPDEIELITSKFKEKKLDKHVFFVKEDELSQELAFIEDGLFQYYSTTELGEERTTYISLPNTFMASLLSYLSEKPSRENIRSLNASVIWIIVKKDVLVLLESIPRFKDFYISLIEWQICCIDKAKFDLITLSAEQRYEKLVREEPELLQLVPLQYIASMLGITPRHLSRLRNKV
jgi:CRP/FNR family transcriptional regulator, anaerobic regulatory protein